MLKRFICALLGASVVTASAQEAVVAENWAAAPLNDEQLIKRVVRESIQEEKEIAIAESKAAAIPVRFTANSQPKIGKYERFAMEFDEAKVPGCLGPDGLKRQSTFIFGGLLALPFLAVAAVRGKCN